MAKKASDGSTLIFYCFDAGLASIEGICIFPWSVVEQYWIRPPGCTTKRKWRHRSIPQPKRLLEFSVYIPPFISMWLFMDYTFELSFSKICCYFIGVIQKTFVQIVRWQRFLVSYMDLNFLENSTKWFPELFLISVATCTFTNLEFLTHVTFE